jgi:hypothetical protein
MAAQLLEVATAVDDQAARIGAELDKGDEPDSDLSVSAWSQLDQLRRQASLLQRALNEV